MELARGLREAMRFRLFIFLGMFFMFKIPLFDLVSLAFLLYFLFWEERDIKFEKNNYLPLILTEVGYKKQTKHTTGELSDTFQITDRQSDFRPNHM